MSIGKHRMAAATILAAGVVGLIAWGRSQADETAAIRAVRGQLQGQWVATLIQAGPNREEGPSVADCRIEFDGKSVDFRRMVGDVDGHGTYLIGSKGDLGKIDLKLDAGWSIGAFEVADDRLAMAINELALPERLGVPTRGRPQRVEPYQGQVLYVFRRGAAGE